MIIVGSITGNNNTVAGKMPAVVQLALWIWRTWLYAQMAAVCRCFSSQYRLSLHEKRLVKGQAESQQLQLQGSAVGMYTCSHADQARSALCSAGNVPPMADLGQLEGLEARVHSGHSDSPMLDGKKWDGAKAYKDSKVCNMLTMGEMHRCGRCQLCLPCAASSWHAWYRDVIVRQELAC